MATISNQLANIVRPSVDRRLWWYLQGRNINMYIPVHDSGKFVFHLTKKAAVLALEALGIPAWTFIKVCKTTQVPEP